jgi:site-specific DNA-cytosine methylase
MPYGPPGSGKPTFRTPRQVLSDLPPDPAHQRQVRIAPKWNPDGPNVLGTMTTAGFEQAHWDGYRQFNMQECKMLQGFDKDHIFNGTETEQRTQIGNAVPPVYWKLIVSHLIQHLLKWKRGQSVQ